MRPSGLSRPKKGTTKACVAPAVWSRASGRHHVGLPPLKVPRRARDSCALVRASVRPRTASHQLVYVYCLTSMPFCVRQKSIGHTKASRRQRRGAGEDPKQATGVVSSLEGSQTRRGAEAVPHAQRLKHRAATGNITSPMPTVLTVSSARKFPRRDAVQRASSVGQPERCLAATSIGRADGSSKKNGQRRPPSSRTACGEAAIARGFSGTSPCGGTHVVRSCDAKSKA